MVDIVFSFTPCLHSNRSSPLNVLLSDYLTDGEVANSTVHWEADSDSHVDDALAVGNHGTLCPGTRQMKKRNDVTRREVDQMQLRVCPVRNIALQSFGYFEFS